MSEQSPLADLITGPARPSEALDFKILPKRQEAILAEAIHALAAVVGELVAEIRADREQRTDRHIKFEPKDQP